LKSGSACFKKLNLLLLVLCILAAELIQTGRSILHFEILKAVISVWNRKECAISLHNMGDKPDYESYEEISPY
jgi:hypothetical protein